MPAYDTLSEALNDLKRRGFTTDFNLSDDAIACAQTQARLHPEQFEIVEHHRFEGPSDPADESVVYAIASTDGRMKGTLVMPFGAYSEAGNEKLISKLRMHEH